ncbi:succinate-semialdehyde dehydrogenase [Klebsiella pneumoniae]|uniref:Succinate-semialdehyde dehydrogenase n=1 Tax=Klebsiella pneumoniae TaxID=573 RepID=A0A377XCJ7_KLEPN|nr:succinate-semialdehyde dehydrogenase [Klebsiella pneumoniae]
MKERLCYWARKKIEGAGNYYAPTVLGNVTAGMTGFRQELFGPVATLTTARDADHALALANDSEFGLSATSIPPTRRRPSALPASWSAAASSSMATAPATPAWPSAA